MPLRTKKRTFLPTVLAVIFAVALPAAAQTVPTIRVRLHPDIAAGGTLPPAALARLEVLAGTGLTLLATTRTGALDLALAGPQDSNSIAATLKALRNDRGVLWAEIPRTASIGAKATQALPPGASLPGQRLLVRLKDDATPDWAALLPRLGARIGTDLALVRQIGNVWVLSVSQPQSPEQLARMAEVMQQDGAIQYADPVKRVFAFAAPNDPYYPQQWEPRTCLFAQRNRPFWRPRWP